MSFPNVAKTLLPPIFEDEHYLCVRKPAGLVVQRGGREGIGSLLSVRDATKPPAAAGIQPCHTIDTYASGVLVLARNTEAARKFSEMVKLNNIEWQYVAVTKGIPRTGSTAPRKTRTAKPRQNPHAGTKQPFRLHILNRHRTRSVTRCTAVGGSEMDVRFRFADAKGPVLGDARLDRRKERRTSGRLFLHLERIAFDHPFTGRRVRLVWPTPKAFDQAAREQDSLTEHLGAALARRVSCLLDEQTDSFRLFNGKADGVPGLVVDKLGPLAVLQLHQGKFEGGLTRAKEAAAWYGRTLDLTACYVKNFVLDRNRHASQRDRELTDPTPLWGQPTEPEIAIRENGLTLLIRPYDGHSVGLFLDHRENRRTVQAMSHGKRVLNAFAYTGGFSVAAAAGGAASTVSVDLAKRALEWGKRNFAANAIPLADHEFFCSDVFDYFKRAERQGRRFDLIILDPPTFARTRKPARIFRITKDLIRVLSGAVELLDPGGILLVSTNARTATVAWLKDQLSDAAGPRRFKVLDSPQLPVDFAGDRDFAKSMIVQFD